MSDFYGHPLQVGDIAAALIDDGDGEAFLALVRITGFGARLAQARLLQRAGVLLANQEISAAGWVPFKIWPRKLIWHTSEFADVADTFVPDILNFPGRNE